MNHENHNQNETQNQSHGHHGWHMIMCLAMLGAVFFLSYRDKDAVPVSPQNATLAKENSFVEQRTQMGSVAIIAQPRRTEDGLVFDLTFDTHSEELDFDATRAVALVDGEGRERVPREWSGDPPSGHHRVIKVFFDAVSDTPLTLLFRGIGGVSERIVKWDTL